MELRRVGREVGVVIYNDRNIVTLQYISCIATHIPVLDLKVGNDARNEVDGANTGHNLAAQKADRANAKIKPDYQMCTRSKCAAQS